MAATETVLLQVARGIVQARLQPVGALRVGGA